MKEQNKPRRCKRRKFDCTTLVCCAIGAMFSVGSAKYMNIKVQNAREAVQRAQMIGEIQRQSGQQLEELEILDSFDVIEQKLLGKKQEITLYGKKESEDSFNAQYEAQLINESKENEESNTEGVEKTTEKQTEEKNDVKSDLEEENSVFKSYSESDYELLCEITYAEAGNQTEEQQVAAAATILNRVESNIFPNTIREVIMQKGQFASTKNGHIYAMGKTVEFSKVPDMTKDAARRALNGEDPTESWLKKEAKRLGLNSKEYASGGALYFYSPEFTSSSELSARASIKCKVQNGGHIFYKVWG